MNELLLSELTSEDKDLLQTLILLEEYILEPTSLLADQNEKQTHNEAELDTLEYIITECQTALAEIESPLDKAELLINELYFRHLFVDSYQQHWPLSAFKVSESLNFRVMSPVIKAAFIVEITEACGFESDIVFVPHKVMVRMVCDDHYAIIFDPVTGESIHWDELDFRMGELDGDPSQHDLEPIDTQVLLVEHINAFKNVLIQEKCFDNALKCVDLLLALHPDDPIQRRDRGYLLHQLECFKVAVDDYRFFVEQCPKDPAAQLLKHQLEHIQLQELILH